MRSDVSSTNSPEWVACPECGAKQNADEQPPAVKPAAPKSSTAASLIAWAMICATVLAAVWLVTR
jgi:hypothetical protein